MKGRTKERWRGGEETKKREVIDEKIKIEGTA